MKMKEQFEYLFGRGGRFTGLFAICLLFLTSGAYAQGAGAPGAARFPCSVNYLRLRIVTGGDDLRGGNDNLNVTVRFGEKGFQGVANVNKGANWPNNSVHTVEIKLIHPVPLNEIKSITLDHLANGGLTISPETVFSPVGVIAGLKTADNWDMRSLEVSAFGNSVGMTILRHGAKRFTANDPVLNTRVEIPANPCAAGSAGNSGPSNGGNNPRVAGSNPTGSNSGAGSPSKKLTPQQIGAISAKVHATAGKSGPVVTNPSAGGSDISIVGLLRQQKQVAMTERSQPSPTTPTPTAPTRTATMARAPALRGPISTTAAPPPPSPTNRGVMMTQPNVNVACGTFNAPMITAVSGQQGSAAVFTQDPQYNPFTIRGCNFGSGKGQAQLNYTNGKKLTDLTVDTWTDNLITVEVPPSLADVLDQNNVSLILFPTNGPQAQRPGLKFYAQRVEIHLTSIPASTVTLAPINDDGYAAVTPKFTSPYVFSGGTNKASGGVDRFDTTRFPGGADVFDFSKLKPGFTVEKYQVHELSAAATSGVCGLLVLNDTDYTDGAWGWQMTGSTIQVAWQEAHAHIPCEDESNASYGLDVWLIGPPLAPGESPWKDGVN